MSSRNLTFRGLSVFTILSRTVIVALLLLPGNGLGVQAKSVDKNTDGKIYFTSDQRTVSHVRVDHIEFGTEYTAVTLYCHRMQHFNARLLPTTKLVCYMSGGKTVVLQMRDAQGISTGEEYTSFRERETFTVIFPPVASEKIRTVDFIEDPSQRWGGAFNVYDIKIDKRQTLVR